MLKLPEIEYVDYIHSESGHVTSGTYSRTHGIKIVRCKNQRKILRHELVHWIIDMLGFKWESRLHNWLDRWGSTNNMSVHCPFCGADVREKRVGDVKFYIRLWSCSCGWRRAIKEKD